MWARYWWGGGRRRHLLLTEFCTEPVLECWFSKNHFDIVLPNQFEQAIWIDVLYAMGFSTYLRLAHAESEPGRWRFLDSKQVIKGTLVGELFEDFGEEPKRLSGLDLAREVTERGRGKIQKREISPYDHRESFRDSNPRAGNFKRADRTFPLSRYKLP